MNRLDAYARAINQARAGDRVSAAGEGDELLITAHPKR